MGAHSFLEQRRTNATPAGLGVEIESRTPIRKSGWIETLGNYRWKGGDRSLALFFVSFFFYFFLSFFFFSFFFFFFFFFWVGGNVFVFFSYIILYL